MQGWGCIKSGLSLCAPACRLSSCVCGVISCSFDPVPPGLFATVCPVHPFRTAPPQWLDRDQPFSLQTRALCFLLQECLAGRIGAHPRRRRRYRWSVLPDFGCIRSRAHIVVGSSVVQLGPTPPAYRGRGTPRPVDGFCPPCSSIGSFVATHGQGYHVARDLLMLGMLLSVGRVMPPCIKRTPVGRAASLRSSQSTPGSSGWHALSPLVSSLQVTGFAGRLLPGCLDPTCCV